MVPLKILNTYQSYEYFLLASGGGIGQTHWNLGSPAPEQLVSSFESLRRSQLGAQSMGINPSFILRSWFKLAEYIQYWFIYIQFLEIFKFFLIVLNNEDYFRALPEPVWFKLDFSTWINGM